MLIISGLWFTVYTASTMLVQVPSCPHVVPAITPNCNVAAFVDCQLLGPNHMFPNPTCRQAEPPCPAFDPEGLYTTLGGAILSTFLGVLFGCASPPSPASTLSWAPIAASHSYQAALVTVAVHHT